MQCVFQQESHTNMTVDKANEWRIVRECHQQNVLKVSKSQINPMSANARWSVPMNVSSDLSN